MDTKARTASIDGLPAELVNHVSTICGSEGDAWLASVPRIAEELSSMWGISVEAPFPGGEYNFVAPAAAADGRRCVLKIAPPFKETEIFSEGKWLRARDGVGAVRFYAEDRERHAILIERVTPGLSLWDAFASEPGGAVGAAIDVMRRTLQPRPADLSDTLTLDRWFDNFRRGYRGSEFPAAYAERAFEIYDRLSVQPGRTFYLHGDFHHGNVLTTEERGPFVAIDAKGLIGHLGYDIAVFINNHLRWRREDPHLVQLLNDAFARFSGAFEIAEGELREFAYAAMIIGEWWSIEDGREPDAAKLAFSDIWGI